jgi:hypothetical protein
MSRRVVWEVVANVSEEPADSIFRTEEMVRTYQTTRRCMSEDRSLDHYHLPSHIRYPNVFLPQNYIRGSKSFRHAVGYSVCRISTQNSLLQSNVSWLYRNTQQLKISVWQCENVAYTNTYQTKWKCAKRTHATLTFRSRKLIVMYRNSVPVSQKTHSIAKTNQFMLLREKVKISVYCENHTKHMITIWAKCIFVFNTEAGGTYSYHCSLKR